MFAHRVRDVGFGIIQQRCDVILRGAFSAALIVNKIDRILVDHDISGLEIPEHKIIAVGGKQVTYQRIEIILQFLLIERYVQQFEKIILEIIEVPSHRLSVESGAGVGLGEIETLSSGHLPLGELSDSLFVIGERFRGGVALFITVGAKVVIEGCCAQVLLQVMLSVGMHTKQAWGVQSMVHEEIGIGEKRLIFGNILIIGSYQSRTVVMRQSIISAA